MAYGTVSLEIGKIQESYETEKGKSIIDFPSEYVVLDLETTGLSPVWDRIIEVGILKIKNGEIIDKYQSLIYPGGIIDGFIEQLTGITNEMLVGAPWIDDVLPDIEAFIGSNIIVGHCTHFDIKFLYNQYLRRLHKPLLNNYIDNMRIARKVFPDLAHHRLIDVVNILNITGSSFHRALSDCEYTYQCHEMMKTIINKRMGGSENFIKMFQKKHIRIDLTKIMPKAEEIDDTNPFYKKECVFTGKLEKYLRTEAAQIVVNLGGTCGNNITKKTNYLIMGNNDYCSKIKDGKSTKQKKAEAYKLTGQDIEIIPESVFYDMIKE